MPFLRENSGRWSLEKIIAFVGGCIPALWLAWRAWSGDLNPARPVNEAIHSTGNYAIWLIVLSLCVSPARRLFMAPKLINMRRTLGVTAFCYAMLHFALYFVQEKFVLTKIASEIVLRIYLTIGFVALLGLIALAATSTDAMIRRLGPRWNTLHKVIYPIAILGIIHFMMQTKVDITEAVMVGGFLIWLLGYRLMHHYVGNVGYLWQIVLTCVAAAITASAEAAWYGVTTGVMWWRVFSANLNIDNIWDLSLRPAHWVLVVGLAVTLASFLWSLRPQARKAPRTRSRAAAGTVQVQSGS